MSDEEPVTGSRIKMKIKFINPSPISSTPGPASATSALSDALVVWKEPEHDPNHEILDSDDPSLATTKTPTPPNCSPSPMGKRKKKLKQVNDEILSHVGKKRRRSYSKSDNVGSSHGFKTARQRKPFSNGVHNPSEVKTSAMIRAEEFQSALSSEFPSFTKPMVKSHVDNGFWMGIPGYFSKEHLPRVDTAVILVDESGKEYQLTYNGPKRGLSAGWRNFSVEQKLRENDVLIFQLVEPCKFKVYVERANNFNELDGALSLLNLEAQIEPNNAEEDREEDKQKALCLTTSKRRCTLPLKNRKTKAIRTLHRVKKGENGYKRTKSSSSDSPDFKTFPKFEDFTIIIDGLCIDSELSEDTRSKYVHLCSIRNDYLHSRLLQGLNSKLIAGIICETVDIFEAIRKCSIMTCHEQFTNWEKTLKSFELLGMSVGFLRERVRRLLQFGFESDGAQEMRKHVEAKLGKIRTEDEIVNLESKIVELKKASEKYSEDIDALKFKAEGFELKFQEEVNALW